jgi:hypothetical protein
MDTSYNLLNRRNHNRKRKEGLSLVQKVTKTGISEDALKSFLLGRKISFFLEEGG